MKRIAPSKLASLTKDRALGVVECAACHCDQTDDDEPCQNNVDGLACGCQERRVLQWVIVCTDKLGVFMGLVDREVCKNLPIKSLTIYNSRMASYWDVATKGVWSLGANGPTPGCRITGAVPEAELCDIHAIYWVTEKALEAWEQEPWG